MHVTSTGKEKRSAAEWQAICERFAQSGLGQKEFCQREATALGSFKTWYRRCGQRRGQREAFVELTSAPVRQASWVVEVEFPSGVYLRVRG